MVVYLGVAEKVMATDLVSRGRVRIKKRTVSDRGRFFSFPGWRFCLLLLVVLVLFYGYLANRVIVLGHTMEQLEQKNKTLRATNAEMKVNVSWLYSVGNLEEEAENFQMVVPREVSYLNVNREIALK